MIDNLNFFFLPCNAQYIQLFADVIVDVLLAYKLVTEEILKNF